MKKFALVALMCTILSAHLYAEEPAQPQPQVKKREKPTTLFGSVDTNFSGFAGFSYSFTKIADTYAHLAGFRAAAIINDNLALGFSGAGLASPTKRSKLSGDEYTGTTPHMELGYGGLLIQYHFSPKSLIHFAIGTTIGGGAVRFNDHNNNDGNDNNTHSGGNKFFYAEPELNAYLNVTRFCRLGAGVSYRFIQGAGGQEFKNKDFNFASVHALAEFGWF